MEAILKIRDIIKEKFCFGTTSFIFIIGYVSFFPKVFGMENNIVAVIFSIMMSASMVRDLTAAPVKHFIIQSVVLVWMALAACLVNILPLALAFILNFITLLLILYAYTYEYSSHIYFPYILSYLFLIFISPVSPQLLPRRLLAMLAGAFSIMLYQLVMGRKRIKETTRDVLSEIIDETHLMIDGLICENNYDCDLKKIDGQIHKLCRAVYDRRKKILCVSDASFALIDVGRGLEHLSVLICQLGKPLSNQDKIMLTKIDTQLLLYRAYLQQEIDTLPRIQSFITKSEKGNELFYHTLVYIQDRLIHMSDPENKTNYRKSILSVKTRFKTAIDISEVRVIYALKTALLLAIATALVRYLNLPHGKWLLFTLASVSLPYCDDVPLKMKKRVQATVLGGMIAIVIYSLFDAAPIRTAVMMLSGYISFYFSDYVATFACSTIGALGGAVFMSSFGWHDNIEMFLIRIGYIIAGVLIGYIVNCIICPYSRSKATKALWKKYKNITELLVTVSNEENPDHQLYYNLVIQARLLEDKLSTNANLENWDDYPEYVRRCRKEVYQAHRRHIENRESAPVFNPDFI